MDGNDLYEPAHVLYIRTPGTPLYTNKAASPAISKVVKSAAQNAVYNNDADAEKLYVKAIFVDEGPILKRFAARAKGSGTRILKRTCHITCVVDER